MKRRALKKKTKAVVSRTGLDLIELDEVRSALNLAISARREAETHANCIRDRALRKKASKLIEDYDIGMME